MTDPSGKSYYQVSFTGVQALVGLVTLLAALALAFFLGAKAGFEKSTSASAPSVVPPGESEASSVPAAPTSTTIAAPPSPAPAPASAATAAAPPAATAAPAPASTQEAPVFEDREAGVPEQAPSRTEIAGETSRTPPSAPASKNPPRKTAPSPREEPSAAPAPKAVSGFYVQIVSTTSKSEATRWKDRLAAKKYRPALSSVDSNKGKMYRVRLGPYPDRDQAKKLADRISAEFHQKAWVAPVK